MDLTKVSGCYSKELRESCYNIKLLVKDKATDVSTMIKFVENVVGSAFIEAEAKKRFISNLNGCKTKEEVDEFCGKVVLHGMYYQPKRA